MAWFSYECPDHGLFKESLNKRMKYFPCPVCTKACRSIIKMGSVQVKERLDNGVMARGVERLANIEEIAEERNRKFSIQQDPEED